MSTPFIEDNDQTRARREHLESIRELVGNVYPNKFRRSHIITNPTGEDTITAVVEAFKAYFPTPQDGARPAPEQLEHFNAVLLQQTDGIRLAGRIATPPRVMGKAAFVHLSDGRERLQIYVRRDDVREMAYGQRTIDGWRLFQLLDHGDFIGVEGFLFVTKTGELSVHVRRFEFLTKALLPMPDKMHGISDPEIRQRQRYADLIASSLKVEREAGELTTREVFERRSRLITEMRRFLDSHGYIEVETPMLTPLASGAAARPFVTHHNALDIDLYLRIAPELYLKRLLVGGFERVYELNRNFRNEGLGYRWNPEFTMLEFYCAYMDVNGMMDFCEAMLRATIKAVTGGTSLRFGQQEIDFGQGFQRLSMRKAIIKYWSQDQRRETFRDNFHFDESWLEDTRSTLMVLQLLIGMGAYYHTAQEELRKAGEDITPVSTIKRAWQYAEEYVQRLFTTDELHDESKRAQCIQGIFEIVAEGELIQPTFITDFPKLISPLSKASPENPAIAERFELFVNGMEIANGFSELNDPVEQYARFEEQMQQRERGDDEAMQMDTDYVRALSYGMPPAAGIGIGVDRLTMLLTNRRTIRDVILFPHMRPQRQAEAQESEAQEASGSDESARES